MSTPDRPDPPSGGLPDSGGFLEAIPRRLRPRAALILGNRIGALLLHFGGELVRVQIFDRAMTLAAQAFTSVFPILIMLGAIVGQQDRLWLVNQLHIPEANKRLLLQALGSSQSNAFGVVAGLVVVISATGLSRALLRAYGAIWSVRVKSAGPAATGRQVAAVLLLVIFIVGGRLLDGVAAWLPVPRVADMVTNLLADCAIAIALPWILLGPAVSRHRLLVAGGVFGVMMVGLRAAGAVYLPRALQSSADRYGTLGLAFTYIGWLYALSFCLLCSAVLAHALTGAVAGLPTLRWPWPKPQERHGETVSAEPSPARDDVREVPSTQADQVARRRRDG